jgi:hypothetical protein
MRGAAYFSNQKGIAESILGSVRHDRRCITVMAGKIAEIA